MGLWHKYSKVAYLAVFLGVVGHASSEFFAVLTGISGPELSVWRFPFRGHRTYCAGPTFSCKP
jgi:hypothetical protein